MASRRSQLRLIQPEDYDFLYRLAIDAGRSWSWRGRPISSESFLATLWENVESQFLICSSNGARLGLAGFYSGNLFHRFSYFRLYLSPHARRSGWPLEGAALILNYGFVHYGLRKIYAEMTPESLSKVSSALTDLFTVEATLKEHFYADGRYVDQYVLALTATPVERG
jgi:RimJ/RimL family protein N-acetyltransferase